MKYPRLFELCVNELANLEFFNPSGGIIISDIHFHATATNVTFVRADAGVEPAFPGLDIYLSAAGTATIIQASPQRIEEAREAPV